MTIDDAMGGKERKKGERRGKGWTKPPQPSHNQIIKRTTGRAKRAKRRWVMLLTSGVLEHADQRRELRGASAMGNVKPTTSRAVDAAGGRRPLGPILLLLGLLLLLLIHGEEQPRACASSAGVVFSG